MCSISRSRCQLVASAWTRSMHFPLLASVAHLRMAHWVASSTRRYTALLHCCRSARNSGCGQYTHRCVTRDDTLWVCCKEAAPMVCTSGLGEIVPSAGRSEAWPYDCWDVQCAAVMTPQTTCFALIPTAPLAFSPRVIPRQWRRCGRAPPAGPARLWWC